MALKAARRKANRRMAFYGHLAVALAVCFFLIIVASWKVAFIVAAAWTLALVPHGYFGMVGLELRDRWIEEEVGRLLQRSRVDERRDVEGKHGRALGELSAALAHEIRNPITAAKSLVAQMAEDPHAEENQGYAKIALEELDRVEKAISHLLRFARHEDVEPRSMDLTVAVESALETLRERVEHSAVRVERDLAPEGRMRGDPEKIRRVLINLFTNGLDAIEAAAPPDPRLVVETGRNLAGTEAWVRVRDNGVGIEPDRLERVFNPFHTSKDSGTGLGLALSKKLVEAHGGTIEIRSEPGEGTEVVLSFPLPAGEESPHA